MAASHSILNWETLTRTVEDIKDPNSFLRNLLFSNVETLWTETITWDKVTGGREMAGFVLKNGAALYVQGDGYGRHSVEAPNIRIKRAFEPSELLYGRAPGGVVFASATTIQSEVRKHIAKDLAKMERMIQNSEE